MSEFYKKHNPALKNIKFYSCNHEPAFKQVCDNHPLDRFVHHSCITNSSINSFMIYCFKEGGPINVPKCYYIYAYSEELPNYNGTYRVIYYKKKEKNSQNSSNESGYLNVMRKILEKGENKPDRTGVGTKSIFGEQIRFDLTNNTLPLLTTKRVALKTCLKELLWFLRGDTNVKILQDQNVHIWDGNSTREFLDSRGLNHLEEGDVGPNYSWQWRHFGAEYKDCHTDSTGKGVDQIERIIRTLKNDPFSRRIVLTSWNPIDVNKTALPSCHIMVVFNVSENKSCPDGNLQLSAHMFQRSCDLFLGIPINIASYAFLTHLIALKVGMEAKELIISTCDTHIYNTHILASKEQLSRKERAFPVLSIDKRVKNLDWNDISIDDFTVIGYYPEKTIKAPMAI
jgi:thymidylate synthase